MTIDDLPTLDHMSFAGNVIPFRRQASHPATSNKGRTKRPATQRARRQPKPVSEMGSVHMVGGKCSHVAQAKVRRSGLRKLNRAGLSETQIKQIGLKTIGQRMAQTRLKLNVTQEEVAARVLITSKSGESSGVERPLSRNAYCMYERDFLEPSFANMISIAKALGVEPAWLAFGETKSTEM